MQPARIAQRRFEKMKLLLCRLGGLCFERHRHDRMFRAESFQMRLKEAEQNLHRVGRIGNLKAVLVARLVRPGESVLWRIAENQSQPDLLDHEIKRAEAQGDLLEKTPENKKKRRGRLDLVLELDCLCENFRWPNESQKPRGSAACLFPEPDRDRTEPGPKLIGREGGELAEGVDAPFVEDGEDVGNLRGADGNG